MPPAARESGTGSGTGSTTAAGRRLAAGAFVGSLVVFLIGIGRPAFWIDEATSVVTASRSWPQLLHLIVVNDPTLGLYYVLTKPWISLSSAEWWVRLPSAVAMAGAVALVSWYAGRLSRIRVGVFAAIFAVMSVSMISRYAQEARPYAFTVLCSVVMVIAWHSASRRHSRRLAVGYSAAIVASGLFHLYSVTLVVALTAAAWLLNRSDRRRNLIWTLVPAGAALVALAPFLALSAVNAPGTNHEFDLGLRSQIFMISGLFTPVGTPPTVTRYSLALAFVTLVLAIVGATTGIKRYRTLTIVSACWAVIPPVLLYLVQWLGVAPTERPRYWLFVVPAWCVLVALGLDRLARRSRLLAAAVLIVAIGLAVPSQINIRGIDGHNRSTSLRDADADAALRVPALAGLPIVAGSPGQIHAIRGYGPDIAGSRFPLSRHPDDEGRFFLTDIPSQDEITTALTEDPAVILLVKGTARYGDWPAALRTAGFDDPVVLCWFGPRQTRQFVVLKRSDADLPNAAEITQQVMASAPDSMSRCAVPDDVGFAQ